MGFLFKSNGSIKTNNKVGSYYKNYILMLSFGINATASEILFFKHAQKYFSKNIVSGFHFCLECSRSFNRLREKLPDFFRLSYSLDKSDRSAFFFYENGKNIFEEIWKSSVFQEKLASLNERDESTIFYCYEIRDKIFNKNFKPTFEDYKSLKYWKEEDTPFIANEEKQWLGMRFYSNLMYVTRLVHTFVHSIIFMIDMNQINLYNTYVRKVVKQVIESVNESLKKCKMIFAIFNSYQLQLRIDENEKEKKSLDSMFSPISLGKNYKTAQEKCQEWLKNDIIQIFSQVKD